MYLKKFTIQNIKCFENETLDFANRGEDFAGWNVLLGGNATGKSTLLQAIAATLVGPQTADRIVDRCNEWVREPHLYGTLSGWFREGQQSRPRQRRTGRIEVELAVTACRELVIDNEAIHGPRIVATKRKHLQRLADFYDSSRPAGWVRCGYGPFRRLTGGGSEDPSRLLSLYDSDRGYDFATLFFEGAAMTDSTAWLSQLYSRSNDPKRDDNSRIKRDLELIVKVMNALLPGGVKVDEVYSDRVSFRTFGGVSLEALRLSDGYRSFLALAIDLLRKIYYATNDLSEVIRTTDQGLAVLMNGVVLIDEVDAHLHPIWQRQLGFLLRRLFPRIQFIVTSHSPFVAQAASDNGLFVLRQKPDEKSVQVTQPLVSVQGLRIDQILTSPLFGLDGTRDVETEQLMQAHADLVAKRHWGQLNPQEKGDLARLEDRLANRLPAPGDSIEERQHQAAVADYTRKTLARLNGDK